MAREKLAKLCERHAKFKEDYYNPIEGLRKAHNLALTREVQWREKIEELAAAQAKLLVYVVNWIVPLLSGIVHFPLGYGTRILRLRNLLLATPTINLSTLDESLFYPEYAACIRVDSFGHEDMPNAFVAVPPCFCPMKTPLLLFSSVMLPFVQQQRNDFQPRAFALICIAYFNQIEIILCNMLK